MSKYSFENMRAVFHHKIVSTNGHKLYLFLTIIYDDCDKFVT